VKLLRITSTALLSVTLMSLAACGDDAAPTAAPTPAVTAAPTTAATSAAASAAPSAVGTASGSADRTLCASANKAGEAMKDSFVAAIQAGEQPTPAVLKKILLDFSDTVTTAAAAAGDSKVAAAVKQMAAQASKAAAAPNPIEAADNPVFVKAGSDLTAACKAAGVSVNF
jgi:hypothetical protein